jgi:hypothetical protein
VYDGSLGGPGHGWLPCPPGVSYCLRVSSMPAGLQLGRLVFKDLPLGRRANKVRAASILTSTLTNMPYKLLSTWSAYADRPEALLADGLHAKQFMESLMQLVTPGEGGADIYPGRRHALPTSDLIWASWLAAPAVSRCLWSRSWSRLATSPARAGTRGTRGGARPAPRRCPDPLSPPSTPELAPDTPHPPPPTGAR